MLKTNVHLQHIYINTRTHIYIYIIDIFINATLITIDLHILTSPLVCQNFHGPEGSTKMEVDN